MREVVERRRRDDDLWDALDEHRDRILATLRAHPPGTGLRGILNPLGHLAEWSKTEPRFVPTSPYFRYEYVNVPSRDPLFSDVGLVHGPKAGLRYDLNDFTALKIEYVREMHRGLSSVNRLGTQLAFAF